MSREARRIGAATGFATILALLSCGGGQDSVGETGAGGATNGATAGSTTMTTASAGSGGAGGGPVDVHADYYVSPQGDDTWSGTLDAPNAGKTDGPFKTLQAAQQAVRMTPRDGRTTPIVVAVRAGTYALDATWTFAAEDSGSASVPIVYEAYPGEQPVVSGGKVLTGWMQAAPGVWKTTVPSGLAFEQLWVNGQRRYRPRANGGKYLRIGTPSTTSSFHYINATDLSAGWYDLNAVELVVFEQWTVSRQRIKSIDASTQTANTTAFQSTASYHGYIANHRYLAENVKEALGKPGEWYLDRQTGELTYDAQSGEDPTTNAEVMAPVLPKLVDASGVAYVTFKGLTFSYTNWVVPDSGYSAGQALWNVPAALTFTDCQHLTVDSCRLTHIGNMGVEIQGSGGFTPTATEPYGIEFINNEISDVGAGGMRIGKQPGSYDASTTAQGVHVANNVLAGGGRFLPSGIAIVVGDSHDDVLEHNEIYDFYQTAISVGYTFASGPNGQPATYPPSLAHDNVVRYNLVHDIGRGVTNDMGGVYLLTCDNTGNVVENNVIHDVINDPGGNGFAAGYGANGLYFDQGTSRVVAENNLVYRVTGNAFQQNQGRADILRNNIFALFRHAAYDHAFWEATGLWATFERNVVLYDQGTTLGDNWMCPAGSDCRSWVDLHDNLYWNTAGSVSFHLTSPQGTYDLATLQSKESEELGSKIANPGFANPTYPTDDFSLAAGSPATALGFVPFDPKQAGRTATTLQPPPVPAAVPLQEPADPASFF